MGVKRPHIAVRYHVETHGDQVPRVIVLHSTESSDHEGTTDILGIAAGWERAGDGLGAHWIIDGDGNIGHGAASTRTCWAVAGANTGKVHVEQIGRAWWSVRLWLVRRRQLASVVDVLAYLCARWSIPAKRSTVHGVALHRDFPGSHWDPGYGYPTRRVLRRVRRRLRAAGRAELCG